ncbi:CPBP family intramembrane glutamic endopeptidase [Flavivirga jejuensis]|uniref:Type II CAAX endopeptidase family protein n=1 Tax=Flavivirga jejuensis TaxID=870487 RepID=A0ABT8WQ43_9FLAO|nr:type II CAAX endopeptidase family protein [Flavivirga jejuensis]MDO5975289.1 type II CAAX endopeptidase family protein [Flavivirga jejuensis]
MKISYFKSFIITLIFIVLVIIDNELKLYKYGIPFITLSYFVACLFLIDRKIIDYKLLKFKAKDVFMVIISAIGFYIVNLILSIVPYIITSNKITIPIDVVYSVKNITILILIVPIAEELFFRGLLTHGISLVHNNKSAVLVSSIIFALLHYYSGGILIAFLGGLYFGYIYVKTENIFLSIIAHIFANTIILFDERIIEFITNKIDLTSNIFMLLVLFIIGVTVCIFSLKKISPAGS